MSEFSDRIAYALPHNKLEAISQLAEILGIPMPELLGDGTTTLQAMCGTILFRHLEQRERDKAWALIQMQHPRVRMRLGHLALQTKYVNPEWGVWSLSREEIEEAIAGHERFQRITTVFSLNPGHLATAHGVWDLAINGASRANALTLAAGAIVLGTTEMSASQLEKLRKERLNRLKPANENADY